ncbi:hypothetical protein [Kitasatospora sp. NPDC001683]
MTRSSSAAMEMSRARSLPVGMPETSWRNRLRRPCFSRVVSAVKSRFSRPIAVASDGDCIHLRESDDPTTVVTTTRAKLHAWINGAKAGEFDHFIA